jgi:GNAT superfamily N-acetyltransferase
LRLRDFEFIGLSASDVDELIALRIAAMRDSLERIGRFDLQRSADRFRRTFRPADTLRVVVDGVSAGCVGFWSEPPDAMRVEHFYLAPAFQRRGLGGAVLARLFAEAPEGIRRFRVGALRESDANRFYRRHGFVEVSRGEWDIEYERPRQAASSLSTSASASSQSATGSSLPGSRESERR